MSDSIKDYRAGSPETASPAVLVMDGAGMVVEWTPDAEAIFGWPRADAIGKRLSTLIIPERLRAAHEAGLKYFLAGGPGKLIDQTIQIVAIDNNGREFDVELRITARKSEDGYMFATSAVRL